jgi:RNA polymerase sigma-70 factor (ECF subfamily)
LTDEQIIQEIRNGNDSVFREFILRYESLVASTVIGMLGKTPEAEDVGQEVFIRFYNSLNNFRGDSAVGTYLTRIAINLSLNELKRRKRRSLFLMYNDDNEKDIADTNRKNEYNENEKIVQIAIQKLPAKQRSVVVLRLIDGYSTRETAEILNLPIGTVLSRLSRAQEKLKDILSPYVRGEL